MEALQIFQTKQLIQLLAQSLSVVLQLNLILSSCSFLGDFSNICQYICAQCVIMKFYVQLTPTRQVTEEYIAESTLPSQICRFASNEILYFLLF